MDVPELLRDQAALDEHCRRWRSAGVFAFDTEFIRDDTFEPVLCLVQVADAAGVTLIDPTAPLELGGFWELVGDPGVRTIVHAGKEDFDLCLRLARKPPRNVFDVQIAAGLVGWGYPLSLARLVEQALDRRISKGQTLTDWLRRPLTDDQLRYAVEDVAHLPEIYRKLRSRLGKLARTEWANEEFRRFEDPETYRPPLQDRLSRFKGSKRLDGLGLLLLGELIEWRDTWAREKNRPLRALMRDDILVEIARRRPRRESDYQVLRGFPQARNLKLIRELIALVERVAATPRSAWPQPAEHREESAMTKVTLDLLSALLQALCHEQNVSRELVGGTQRLRELLDYQAGHCTEAPPLLRGWRAKFVGERLLDFLAGRSEIHLSGWPESPRLGIVVHQSAAPRSPE